MNKNVLLVVLVLIGINLSAQKQRDKPLKRSSVTIQTSGLCEMCKEHIETALAYEKGVKSSNFDEKTGKVVVYYNPDKVSTDKLKQTISSIGYDADDIKADKKAFDKLDECCKKESGEVKKMMKK